MSVVIIDYGSGNLHSAHKAFERAVAEQHLSTSVIVTSEPDLIAKAERIVLPGVGAFADCRAGLAAVAGLHEALDMAVIQKGRPFLGICVGMQLMASRGLEHQVTAGLGWIEGDVEIIRPQDPALKIPHMGWNALEVNRPHALLADIPTGQTGWNAYFVHSYHLHAARTQDVIATTDYGNPVTAMVGRDNLVGTQFHPEKSQRLGLALIGNFLRWVP